MKTKSISSLILEVSNFLKSNETTLIQYLILSLVEDGPRSMTALARDMTVSTAAMTGAVDRMEKLNLVKRHPSDSDRRIIEITCTGRGAALLKDVRAQFGHALKKTYQ